MNKKLATWDLFFNTMLKRAMLPIVVTDKRGRIVFVNESYRKYLSLPKKVLVGKNWIDDFMPEEERQAAHKLFRSIRRKGTSCFKFHAPLRVGKRKEKILQWLGILLEKDDEFFLTSIGRPTKKARAKAAKSCIVTTKAEATYAEAIAMIFVISKIIGPDIAEHSVRVTSLAVDLAKKLKISRRRIEKLKIASYLHDIGKLAVSGKILNKKGPLTKKEFEEIKTHALKGVTMVEPLYFLREVIFIIQSHHENYDGKGYPFGLKGENIPLEARVLAIADVYEALTSDRPYRKAFSRKEAIAIMEKERARKLDPKLTDIFLNMVKRKRTR